MTGIDALTMLRSGKAVLITLTDDYRIQIEATNEILPNGEVETSIRVYGTQLNNDILLYYLLNEKWTVMK
jgi:hypothetical protein